MTTNPRDSDTATVTGYWFAASDVLSHGDGRRVVIGETLSVEGEIVPCGNGLHWSRDPFDALGHAQGYLLYRVEASGDTVEEDDKGCSRHRKTLAVIDATGLLQEFARKQALSVAHLWDMPPIVREYLETGNSEIADEATRAARDAADEAADDAADEATKAACYAADETAEAAYLAADAAARAVYLAETGNSEIADDAARAAYAANEAAVAACHAAKVAEAAYLAAEVAEVARAARDAAARAAAEAARAAAADEAAAANAANAARDATRKLFNEMVKTAFDANERLAEGAT